MSKAHIRSHFLPKYEALSDRLKRLGNLLSMALSQFAMRPMPKASGVEALRYLMREHGMSQSDLPGVGTQSVVSEVLSGKRQLNLRQIRWLAGRFGVSVETFI